MTKFVASVILLIVWTVIVLGIISVLQRVSAHDLDKQAEAALATDFIRGEFGSRPPDCAGLSGVDWQHCMGVGPR